MVYNERGRGSGVARVPDAPPDALIARLADALRGEDIPAPAWAPFVKTGVHADKPPQDRRWWHVRCASLLRKIYVRGPVGIRQLRDEYGGGKPRGYGAAHHRPAGGAIIRTAVQGLERLGYVEKSGRNGRIVTSEGARKLDRMATEIVKEMAADNPRLKMYA